MIKSEMSGRNVGGKALAMIGVALLGWSQARVPHDAASPFRLVLWLSVIPGVLAVLAFLTLVADPEESPNPALRLLTSLRALPSRFKRYLVAIGVFGAGDFSHSLLILAATQLLTPTMGIVRAAQMAGLLYVWRNVVQIAISFPVGALADRIGHARVLVGGYVLGAVTAALTAVAFSMRVSSLPLLAAIFAVAGVYIAVQDALESTVAAELVPGDMLSTGYGALGTVNGVMKFISSSMIGIAWTAGSPVLSFAIAATLMLAGTLALARTAVRASA